MSLSPLDLLSAHPWQRVTFTTYALSLSFFEAVILDRLIRGARSGGQQALILADVQGLRASLSEQGAQRVGKEYEAEPVAVSSGVFHPKLSVLSAERECHLLVGSGNLTFNGWGGNCEILEHLHPSFAADAFADAADFFELLSVTDRVRHGAEEGCNRTAADLRIAVEGQPRTGNIRLLHNLDRSISEQLVGIANDLGGATQLLVAAPFWDKGAAIDRLCEGLGLDQIFIHAHATGTVEGTAGANWPLACRNLIHPVRLDIMKDDRRLHAKAIEIMCKRGRVLVSGSANATNAALGAGGNVEACVVRIQRDHPAGWTFTSTEAPEPQAALDDESDKDEKKTGVLRAVLEAEKLRGEVLTPTMSGAVSIFYISGAGPELLAETNLLPKGGFEISAPKLEQKSWLGGRLVIRIVDGRGRQADGFVSVASFAEITRRAGPVAGRIFAMISGTETPADLAAVLSGLHENPGWLAASMPQGIGGGGKGTNTPDKPSLQIIVAELSEVAVAGAGAQTPAGHKSSGDGMSRLMEQLLHALRQKRGPFLGPGGAGNDDDDDEDENGGNNGVGKDKNKDKEKEKEKAKKANDEAIRQSYANFEKILAAWLKPGGDARQALNAFDLTQYVCDRLLPEEPQQVVRWLKQLMSVMLERGVPPERRDDVAAAILTLLGADGRFIDVRRARGWLMRLGFDVCGQAPRSDGVTVFQSVLKQSRDFPALWQDVQAIRTYPEQVRFYLDILDKKLPSGDFGELESAAKEEWTVMKAALKSREPYRSIILCKKVSDYCPRCFIGLPSGEVGKLNQIGIATAKNCCRKVLIVAGE